MKNQTITIARQYGSGGREVGQKLAQKMDLPFYDKELVAIAAKKSGMSEKLFQTADERHTSSLLYSLSIGNYSYDTPGTSTNLLLNDRLFLLQSQIIEDAAKKGPCVIVGRCGNYILRDKANVFRVFLYADREIRIQHAIETYGLDPKKAGSIVSKMDRQRSAYFNFYTGQKWNDFSNYDLCLNTGRMGIDRVVECISALAAE